MADQTVNPAPDEGHAPDPVLDAPREEHPATDEPQIDEPRVDTGYTERADAAVAAAEEARRPGGAPPDMQVVTQEQDRDARSDHTPVRDEASHAAAQANEAAALAPDPPRNPPSEQEGVRLDQAPVRDEDAVHLDLAADDRIPVNARAMLLGDLPHGTETCWHCGHEKPRPARPGRDRPEEFCPFCGRGSRAEQD